MNVARQRMSAQGIANGSQLEQSVFEVHFDAGEGLSPYGRLGINLAALLDVDERGANGTEANEQLLVLRRVLMLVLNHVGDFLSNLNGVLHGTESGAGVEQQDLHVEDDGVCVFGWAAQSGILAPNQVAGEKRRSWEWRWAVAFRVLRIRSRFASPDDLDSADSLAEKEALDVLAKYNQYERAMGRHAAGNCESKSGG
ncbi:hypothetical protein FGB62_8g115 [Gracilaria domingensis]|nr:hypothetical protein FGB62_8g115 [Gracilaria domingensis]